MDFRRLGTLEPRGLQPGPAASRTGLEASETPRAAVGPLLATSKLLEAASGHPQEVLGLPGRPSKTIAKIIKIMNIVENESIWLGLD